MDRRGRAAEVKRIVDWEALPGSDDVRDLGVMVETPAAFYRF